MLVLMIWVHVTIFNNNINRLRIAALSKKIMFLYSAITLLPALPLDVNALIVIGPEFTFTGEV